MRLALALAISYLLGSVPTAVWVGRLVRGVDVREHGSRNAGATNALRVLGLRWGLVVLFVDVGKGLMAVLLVSRIVPQEMFSDHQLAGILTGSLAIVGHVFPVTLGFRGGKGVGTGAGVMFALLPLVTLSAVVLWAAIVVATRYVSLGSMVAAIFVPLMLLLQMRIAGGDLSRSLLLFSLALAAVVLLSHHANIRRLLEGRENKITLGGSRTRRKS
jgi:glycerol-3-phosphate acyltransferase PlsY